MYMCISYQNTNIVYCVEITESGEVRSNIVKRPRKVGEVLKALSDIAESGTDREKKVKAFMGSVLLGSLIPILGEGWEEVTIKPCTCTVSKENANEVYTVGQLIEEQKKAGIKEVEETEKYLKEIGVDPNSVYMYIVA